MSHDGGGVELAAPPPGGGGLAWPTEVWHSQQPGKSRLNFPVSVVSTCAVHACGIGRSTACKILDVWHAEQPLALPNSASGYYSSIGRFAACESVRFSDMSQKYDKSGQPSPSKLVQTGQFGKNPKYLPLRILTLFTVSPATHKILCEFPNRKSRFTPLTKTLSFPQPIPPQQLTTATPCRVKSSLHFL